MFSVMSALFPRAQRPANTARLQVLRPRGAERLKDRMAQRRAAAKAAAALVCVCLFVAARGHAGHHGASDSDLEGHDVPTVGKATLEGEGVVVTWSLTDDTVSFNVASVHPSLCARACSDDAHTRTRLRRFPARSHAHAHTRIAACQRGGHRAGAQHGGLHGVRGVDKHRRRHWLRGQLLDERCVWHPVSRVRACVCAGAAAVARRAARARSA
jgi:hypothetical protein